MKNPLQITLIVLALGLCVICSWQWYGQALDRRQITSLIQTNYDLSVSIQGYSNTINKLDQQIAQMDTRMTELRQTVTSNNLMISKLNLENGRLSSMVEKYSNAVEVVVGQRDEFVKKFNDSMNERNEVVAKYNDLVKQVENMQLEQAKKQKKEK